MERAMEEGDCLSQEEESTWNDDLDISQLCRICANPNEYLIPIFKGEGQEHELELKITKHLPIKVAENDELPTKLCYQCASTLIAWHDMVEGCMEADEKLKAITNYKTVNNTKVTSESIAKETGIKNLSDPQANDIPLTKLNNVVHITQVQDLRSVTSVDTEEVVFEEEIASVKPEIPEMMEDETAESRCVKMEEDNDDENDDALEDELMSDDELESDEDYGTLYHCNICKAANMTLQDFLSHTKLHTKDEKQLALARIINSKKVNEDAAKSAAASFGFRVQESVESSVTLYQCIVCGQGNLLLGSVKEHSSIHPHYLESHFCSICQRQFPNQKSLTSHAEVHLDNNDLICQYCNKRFETIDDLEEHEDQHYSAEYMCVDCRENFRSKELVLIHLRDFHADDTTCLICDVEFKSDQVLTKHFINHAVVCALKRPLQTFSCDLCGKKYDSKVSLQRHKLFLHNDRLPFICEHCGFFVYHESPLREHVEREHIEKANCCVCVKCGPSTNSDSQVVEGVCKGNNVCKLCGVAFKLRINLKRHLKSHGEVRNTKSFPSTKHVEPLPKKDTPLACSRCCEIFTADDFCVTHSLYHLDSVLCDLCGKSFKSETALNLHLNENHVNNCKKPNEDNDLFPFKCKDCNLAFKLEFQLDDHCEIHEDVRYQCHYCFDEFTTDDDLQDHLNYHKQVNDYD